MTKYTLTTLSLTLPLVLGSISHTASASALFTGSNFVGSCGSTLNCFGSASSSSGNLQLNSNSTYSAGSAFTKSALTLGAGQVFSTQFQFQIGGGTGADGIAFILGDTQGLGSAGGGLGYQGLGGRSLAIEFDTYRNAIDPNANHVGIDTNGSITSLTTATPNALLSNNALWTALISYDGTYLDVKLQNGSNPLQSLIRYAINLTSVLGTGSVYAGFSGGTGALAQNQTILSGWSMYNDANFGAGSGVPEPGMLALLGLGFAVMGWQKRWKYQLPWG